MSPRKRRGKKERTEHETKKPGDRDLELASRRLAALQVDEWRALLAGGTVLEGDCRKLIRQIPDGSVDLVIADPPYGMGYQSHRSGNRKRFPPMENDEFEDALNLCAAMAPELDRVLKPDAHIYIFCRPLLIPPFVGHIRSGIQSFPWKWAGMLTYIKGRGMGANDGSAYVPGWEAVLWFQKGTRKLNGHPSDVIWVGKTVKPHMVHPAQKDVYGISVLVEVSSNPGEVVLDFTAGSGTTGAACRMTPEIARKVILMEKDPKYAAICRERMRLYGPVETELPTPLLSPRKRGESKK